jgi:hypothetical protein
MDLEVKGFITAAPCHGLTLDYIGCIIPVYLSVYHILRTPIHASGGSVLLSEISVINHLHNRTVHGKRLGQMHVTASAAETRLIATI